MAHRQNHAYLSWFSGDCSRAPSTATSGVRSLGDDSHRWVNDSVTDRGLENRHLARMGSMVSLNGRDQVKGVLLGCLFYVGALGVQRAENLTSKVAFIRQSWAQETDYPRPYHVFMPEKAQSKPLKLILFLHGNGGTPLGAKKQFFRQFPYFAQHYACVFPEGYAKV